MGSKFSFIGDIIKLISAFLVVLVMILLMLLGAYHALLEEPERLPYKAMVYDRSNKAIISYDAVCEVKDGVLSLYDATELGREDVSHLVE